MDTLNLLMDRFHIISESSNYILEKISLHRPRAPQINSDAVSLHQNTIRRALQKYLYPWQIEQIDQYRRSEITEADVLHDFFTGDVPAHPVPKDNHYYRALAFTTKHFAPPKKCRPVHILDVLHHYPFKRTTNAEAPFSTEKFYLDILNSTEYREKRELSENPKASTGNMLDIIFDYTREWHHEIKDGSRPITAYLFYMLLHSKTALVKATDPNKLRTIWGTPKPFVIAEIMFHWALFAYWKRNPGKGPMLWGYETITGGWFRLNHELYRSYIKTTIIMIDKKRFDKYALFEVYDDLDKMTRSFLDFRKGYMPTKEYSEHHYRDWSTAKAARLERLWQWTCYAFRFTPIVLPDGRTYVRKHAGVPSGLYTTQYRDSEYNYITIVTCLFAMGFQEEQIILLKVQGDDSIFQIAMMIEPPMHDTFLDEFWKYDEYYFGSVINVEKSRIRNTPNGCEVLGYTNHNGIPHRDPIALLAQFYHTKSSNPTPSKTMAAAIGFAYASCGIHPQVYRVCKEVYEYYANEGITPTPTDLGSFIYMDPDIEYKLDVGHFPSIFEIQARLLDFSYEAPETMKTFWPEWFTAKY